MPKQENGFPVTSTEEICLFPECDKFVRCRGLCNNHYGIAAFQVSRGRVTWSDLEARGCCTASRKRPRNGSAADWFRTHGVNGTNGGSK